MKFDVLGLLAACSYALDCVEAELIKVTNNHSKRVAYMAVCTAEKKLPRRRNQTIYLLTLLQILLFFSTHPNLIS